MSWLLFWQITLLVTWIGIISAVVAESIIKDYFKYRSRSNAAE